MRLPQRRLPIDGCFIDRTPPDLAVARPPSPQGGGLGCRTFFASDRDSEVAESSSPPPRGEGGPRSGSGGARSNRSTTLMPHTNIQTKTRTRARSLRNAPTRAEQKLWYSLRTLRAQGVHFRRQAPIGPYIADFACHGEKLVLE
ncbi:MAG: DUF559 domain-containing protein, partial [Pseudomonadota bacterium]